MSYRKEKQQKGEIQDPKNIGKMKKRIKKSQDQDEIQLGKGAFSNVIAFTSKPDVAIKQVILQLKKIQLNVTNIRSIINQINIMRDCNHPNITKYIKSSLLSQNLFGVEMERALCSLQNWVGKWEYLFNTKTKKEKKNKGEIQQEECPSIDLLIDWLVQLCLALSYLKRKHILHRDIKTTNILIFQNQRVKLCDFGVGAYEDTIRIPSRKKSKDFEVKNVFHVGTPCYMAPELVKGNLSNQEEKHQRSRQKFKVSNQILYKLPYGYEIDVWSLGVTFYQVLFNKFPFKGDTKDVYFQSILDDQPSFPIISQQNYQQLLEHIKFKKPMYSNQQNQSQKLKKLLCGVKMMLQKQPYLRATPEDILTLFESHIDKFNRERSNIL